MDRRSSTTYLMLTGGAALLGLALLLPRPTPTITTTPPPPPRPLVLTPPPPPPRTNEARPQVDVVFVLDTTGSMSSLIDGAKKKIWEISRFIAQGQPAPELRVGLVAYRDVGDEYVTRFYDLSGDLDAVYQNLSSFTASGGGDPPEHVAKALEDAVSRASWSQDKSTLRLVYLVGDAPPHRDYSDGPNYQAIAQRAGERGIRINTIRCGADRATELAWREIAARSHGEYASIDQSGGVVDTSTPYDDELARLNQQLLGTAVGYGSEDKRREWDQKTAAAAAAPKAAQAERAGFFGLFSRKGGRSTAVAEGDLLDDVAANKVKLESVDPKALPAPVAALPPEGRAAFVAKKQEERKAIVEQINRVSAERDAYLKKAAPAKPDSFDGQVRSALKKQAGSVGLKY